MVLPAAFSWVDHKALDSPRWGRHRQLHRRHRDLSTDGSNAEDCDDDVLHIVQTMASILLSVEFCACLMRLAAAGGLLKSHNNT
jgi:hypothetical protein